jgi:hypothetical protein
VINLGQIHKTRSWYGSWPRIPKSSASTQVARENIFGGTLKPSSSPDFRRFETKRSSDNSSVDAVSNSTTVPPSTGEAANLGTDGETGNAMAVDGPNDEPRESESKPVDEALHQDHNLPPLLKPDAVLNTARPATSSGWLGWFARPGTADTPLPNTEEPTQKGIDSVKEAEQERGQQLKQEPPQLDPVQESPQETANTQPAIPTATTSWFDFWHAKNTSLAATVEEQKLTKPTEELASNQGKDTEDVVMGDAPPPNPEPIPQPQAGSTWAFWSRDSGPKKSGTSTPQTEPGELAVIGEGSEAHPKPANSTTVKDTPFKEVAQDPKLKPAATPVAGKKNKRLRPQSMDIEYSSPTPSGASTPVPESSSRLPKQDGVAKIDGMAKPDGTAKVSPTKETASKDLPPNLLLPSFNSTYQMKGNPSIMKQIAQLLLRTKQPPANHVYKLKEAPKIKKAIAIGVHGLFPATYLRPMIGQPTGTSLRFANLCADAIRRWANKNDCGDCEIEKVALEGEGKIADRVDNLWKLLLNWIEHIRGAELIILACHSQGVPVAIMLLEKLIDLGIITNAKIGVCAMGEFLDNNNIR